MTRCVITLAGAPANFSPSWLAALRFTSVEKHPGAPVRCDGHDGARVGVFVDEA